MTKTIAAGTLQQATVNDKKLLSGKKILITGAKGFIGSHLVNELSEANAEVHATSRISMENTRHISWWQGTMQDESFATALFSEVKPDIVFHLAGDVTAANSVSHVLTTYHSLLTSTINIMTLADKYQCERVVLTGSGTEPVDENPVPNSPYSAAKWATTMYGKLFCNLYKLPVVLIRPFMGYGPGQPVGKIIPFVINSFINNKAPLLSNGYWVTDWIYIKDMVQGILAAGTAENCTGIPLDLGTGALTSVRQIIEKITDIMMPVNKPVFGALPDRHVEHTRMANTELAFQKMNWKATTSLEEGLQQTINWFMDAASTKRN